MTKLRLERLGRLLKCGDGIQIQVPDARYLCITSYTASVAIKLGRGSGLNRKTGIVLRMAF